MATIETSVSKEITVPPLTVFAVVSDPSRMSEWINGVQSAGWEEGASLRVGARFDMKNKYGRKVHDIKMEITASEAGSLLEYRTVEGPYPIQGRFVLRPSGDGTALTYNQTAYSDSRLAAIGFYVTGWLAKPMMRRMLRKDLEKLATILQASG